jgi:hypothetical protein
MSHSPIQTLGLILTPLVTALVVWRGGRPERITALTSFAAFLITPAAQALSGRHWPLWGVAVVDTSLCALLVALAMIYDRTWLILAAGVELATVTAHLGMILDLTLMARGYVVSLWIFYFIFLATLAYGVVEVRQRRARGLAA